MKLLDGLQQIHSLPESKQKRFERFFSIQKRFRLLPLFVDLSLCITSFGTALYFLFEGLKNGVAEIHPLSYLYTGILFLLLVLHRVTRIRHAAPFMAYLLFSQVAVFSYLAYIGNGGGILPLIGLHFFVSSLGIVTLSLFHTSVMLAVNLILLTLATSVLVPPQNLLPAIGEVLGNWFIAMCFLIALVSARFNHWLFRNILALQFLLKDRNQVLTETLRTLHVTEEQLIQQQKQQALSLMAKGLLHEIMNPVNCAAQAIGYAASVNKDADVAEALEDATLHQGRISNIVADLIDFSQPHPEHSRESASLYQLVNTALRFCRNDLKSLQVDLQVDHNLVLSCYPSSLVQVFVNLLLNSASALASASPQNPATIRIASSADEDGVRVSLRDNGKGIAPEALRRLTEPFFSTSESSGNLGLGLSICQTIMRHHGGQIEIESEQGAWTQVNLIFPKELVTAAQAPPVHQNLA